MKGCGQGQKEGVAKGRGERMLIWQLRNSILLEQDGGE